jgi:hypothetical protein
MENPFAEFENEEIFINRQDGTRIGPIKASFDHETFTIWRDDIEIEGGDSIDHPINDSKSERYPVIDVKFTKRFTEIPAHFDITVRPTASMVETPKPSVTNIHISNSQGFQVGDHNTQNIIDGFKTLISEIEKTSASPADKKEAKGKLASFLEHPLTVGILGGAAGGLTALLKHIWDRGEKPDAVETGNSVVRIWKLSELTQYLKYEVGKWKYLPCCLLRRRLRIGAKLKGSGRIHFNRMDASTAAPNHKGGADI